MRQHTSALVRLQNLPPMFRGSDLTIRFQWTSKAASQYLYLWKVRGLVRGLGGKSDVYANMLTSPAPDWGKALLMAMPSAVTIGVEALRQAGWTTQVPNRPSVAVNSQQSVFTVEPFDIEPRNPRWFDTVGTGIERALGCLPVLRPAWALADLLGTQGWGSCGLWPDDIDWEQIGTADQADWPTACKAFGLPYRSLCERLWK